MESKHDHSSDAGRRRATDEALRGERVGENEEERATAARRTGTNERLFEERAECDRELTRERDVSVERGRLLAEARAARSLAESATRDAEAARAGAAAATRRAEAAARMRDEFLAIVSHDLRNPVGAILMNATLALSRMSELERASRAHRSLEAIERAARRAIRMIDDLLDVSAIDAGGLSFEASPYPVNRLVAETVETFRPLATERSIRLEANAATATTSEVLCDSGRILQVLSNLIGNALKFTPAGGEVTLSAEPRGRSVVFSVSDTGRGIPEDEREKVFARFWQQRPEGGHGVGLGLYISKSVVEAHGGRMGFESRPGGGTRFFFTLPGVEGADRAKAA